MSDEQLPASAVTVLPWMMTSSTAPVSALSLIRVEVGANEGMLGLGVIGPAFGDRAVSLVAPREKWVELIIQVIDALGVREEEILTGQSGLVIARSMGDVEDLR